MQTNYSVYVKLINHSTQKRTKSVFSLIFPRFLINQTKEYNHKSVMQNQSNLLIPLSKKALKKNGFDNKQQQNQTNPLPIPTKQSQNQDFMLKTTVIITATLKNI